MKKKGRRAARTAAPLAAAFLAALLLLAGCEAVPNDGSGGDKDNAIRLFEGSFKDGNVAKNGEQWFSFTVASAGTYYIHVIFGTVEYLNLRVFNRNGSPVGGEVNLREHGAAWYFSRELPEPGTYRIRVRPYYSGDSGTYRIAYNTAAAAPQ
ncbi:MAG: hypothetical protein LBJ86_00265 [Spirochaetaceae bacterium]|jgi:hypothetical protein|nr:hypothetical protein [Spirochaetaceae bacterium]